MVDRQEILDEFSEIYDDLTESCYKLCIADYQKPKNKACLDGAQRKCKYCIKETKKYMRKEAELEEIELINKISVENKSGGRGIIISIK